MPAARTPARHGGEDDWVYRCKRRNGKTGLERSPAAVAAVDGSVDLHAQQLGGAVRVSGHLDAGDNARGDGDLHQRQGRAAARAVTANGGGGAQGAAGSAPAARPMARKRDTWGRQAAALPPSRAPAEMTRRPQGPSSPPSSPSPAPPPPPARRRRAPCRRQWGIPPRTQTPEGWAAAQSAAAPRPSRTPRRPLRGGRRCGAWGQAGSLGRGACALGCCKALARGACSAAALLRARVPWRRTGEQRDIALRADGQHACQPLAVVAALLHLDLQRAHPGFGLRLGLGVSWEDQRAEMLAARHERGAVGRMPRTCGHPNTAWVCPAKAR